MVPGLVDCVRWVLVRRSRACVDLGGVVAPVSDNGLRRILLALRGVSKASAAALKLLSGAIACAATTDKRSTQNWHGHGESDCLIKTKHCDGVYSVLTQCDFCPVL